MKITNNEIENLGDELLEWVKESSDNISINSFFALKGYTKKAVDNFKKSKTDFSEKYELAMGIIEGYLLAKLENRNVSTAGIKYLLENLCGYDKESSSPTVVLSQTELDRIRLRFFPKNGEKKEEQEEEQED